MENIPLCWLCEHYKGSKCELQGTLISIANVQRYAVQWTCPFFVLDMQAGYSPDLIHRVKNVRAILKKQGQIPPKTKSMV